MFFHLLWFVDGKLWLDKFPLGVWSRPPVNLIRKLFVRQFGLSGTHSEVGGILVLIPSINSSRLEHVVSLGAHVPF